MASPHQTAYPDEVRQACETDKIPAKVAQKVLEPEKKPSKQEKDKKKVIDNTAPSPYIDVNDTFPKLSAEESLIVAALKSGERLVDDIIAETGMTTGKLLALLTMLELKGVIRRLPGKRVSLK